MKPITLPHNRKSLLAVLGIILLVVGIAPTIALADEKPLSGLTPLQPKVAVMEAQAVTMSDLSNGTLTITASENGSVFITCAGGLVKVNGKDPESIPIACADLAAIVVNGGSGNNVLNLGGVTTAEFPNLTSVTVDGRAGKDAIIASEFSDIIMGGDGEDVMVGVQAGDQVNGGSGMTYYL